MTNDEMIAKALKADFAREIAMYKRIPNHIFSQKFKKRMKLLINPNQYEYEMPVKKMPLRKTITFAIIAVILMAFLTGATLAAYKLWDYYRIRDYGLYSMLYISDYKDYPKTLEDRYRLPMNMSIYTEEIFLDEDFEYWASYEKINSEVSISFFQMTKETAEQMFINTENSLVIPMEVMVGNCKGIYFETYYEEKIIIWDCGDYILDISGYGVSQNELFSLAESVQKIE